MLFFCSRRTYMSSGRFELDGFPAFLPTPSDLQIAELSMCGYMVCKVQVFICGLTWVWKACWAQAFMQSSLRLLGEKTDHCAQEVMCRSDLHISNSTVGIYSVGVSTHHNTGTCFYARSSQHIHTSFLLQSEDKICLWVWLIRRQCKQAGVMAVI